MAELRKQARRLKEPSYLEDLLDPLLPDDRRYALLLMCEVEELRENGGPFPPAADLEKEQCVQQCALRCVSCDKQLGSRRLFCGPLCQQTAQTVRYVRRTWADRRIERPHVQEGIGIRLLMLASGGYPGEQRKLSDEQRQQIMERDRFTCQRCGKPGNQIDHIAGNTDGRENLRVLCGECNRSEAFGNARQANEEEAAAIKKMLRELAKRIAALNPTLLCDADQWNKRHSIIGSARRRLLRELDEEEDSEFEDVDGYLYDAMQKDD
jgi:hypothetical protein